MPKKRKSWDKKDEKVFVFHHDHLCSNERFHNEHFFNPAPLTTKVKVIQHTMNRSTLSVGRKLRLVGSVWLRIYSHELITARQNANAMTGHDIANCTLSSSSYRPLPSSFHPFTYLTSRFPDICVQDICVRSLVSDHLCPVILCPVFVCPVHLCPGLFVSRPIVSNHSVLNMLKTILPNWQLAKFKDSPVLVPSSPEYLPQYLVGSPSTKWVSQYSVGSPSTRQSTETVRGNIRNMIEVAAIHAAHAPPAPPSITQPQLQGIVLDYYSCEDVCHCLSISASTSAK